MKLADKLVYLESDNGVVPVRWNQVDQVRKVKGHGTVFYMRDGTHVSEHADSYDRVRSMLKSKYSVYEIDIGRVHRIVPSKKLGSPKNNDLLKYVLLNQDISVVSQDGTVTANEKNNLMILRQLKSHDWDMAYWNRWCSVPIEKRPDIMELVERLLRDGKCPQDIAGVMLSVMRSSLPDEEKERLSELACKDDPEIAFDLLASGYFLFGRLYKRLLELTANNPPADAIQFYLDKYKVSESGRLQERYRLKWNIYAEKPWGRVKMVLGQSSFKSLNPRFSLPITPVGGGLKAAQYEEELVLRMIRSVLEHGNRVQLDKVYSNLFRIGDEKIIQEKLGMRRNLKLLINGRLIGKMLPYQIPRQLSATYARYDSAYFMECFQLAWERNGHKLNDEYMWDMLRSWMYVFIGPGKPIGLANVSQSPRLKRGVTSMLRVIEEAAEEALRIPDKKLFDDDGRQYRHLLKNVVVNKSFLKLAETFNEQKFVQLQSRVEERVRSKSWKDIGVTLVLDLARHSPELARSMLKNGIRIRSLSEMDCVNLSRKPDVFRDGKMRRMLEDYFLERGLYTQAKEMFSYWATDANI